MEILLWTGLFVLLFIALIFIVTSIATLFMFIGPPADTFDVEIEEKPNRRK